MMNDPVSMPKIDLHCHLDGSFSRGYVMRTLELSELDDAKLHAPENCKSLTEYLTCFDLPISCLQTKEHITEGVIDVIAQAAKENVRYIELRFAPACSVNNNLDLPSVIEAAISGCKKAFDKYGVFSNLILCAMRHHTLKQNLAVVRHTREFLGYGVCALDLAGDEAGFPNEDFKELFEEANRLGVPFTIHSGECGRTENVRLALAYGAKRVGHGIALIKDKNLMAECRNARIGFELCPTSNFQTKAVTTYEAYPLRTFLDYGLLATINTDNRTVSSTSCTKEFLFAEQQLQITKEDFLTLYKNSVEISFADDSVKHQLLYLCGA
ncbi:MAG: adenosine deaminase [Wujia sp.]